MRHRRVCDRFQRIGPSSAIAGLAICVMALHAWGQETPAPGPREQPTAPQPAVAPGLPVALYPLELLGLPAPSSQRGGLTLTPSIAASEEYNDNIFLDNQSKQWDLITGFTPAITLSVNRPEYELSAGYSFTADLYAREDRFNQIFARQNAVATGLYRVTPGLTLTVSETFAYDRNTNVVAAQGLSTGRQESWSNTFTPGVRWQMTARDSLNLNATYSALRFVGEGSGLGSDTYEFLSALNHAFTPRLTGIVGYGWTNLQPERQIESTTHTPGLGARYRFTPTLTGLIVGGPAITQFDGDTIMSPAGTASLFQALSFGSASVEYARSVRVAGGFGGTTDTQILSSELMFSSLQRGLLVAFRPAYSIVESVSSQQTEQVSLKTFTLSLVASYQIARLFTVFGGYTFLHQRTGGSSTLQANVDQNRVRFGLQFGYPINFD